MGLLDNLLGQVGQMLGGTATGTTQNNLLGGIIEMVQQHPEGLQGLMNQFNGAGLGNIVQSWISTGQNLPISPEQIQGALNNEQLQTLAAKAGVNPQEVATQLSSLLPGLVDKLTPNGQLPTGGIVDHLQGLLGGLGNLGGTK